MADRRRRTEAQKAKTQRDRRDRHARQQREDIWRKAALAAHANGHPLNIAFTISQSALVAEDGHREDFTALTHEEQEKRMSAALRRLAQKHGIPWLSLRAPEYDPTKKRHVHIVAHFPEDAMREAIGAIERLTGVPATLLDLKGVRLGKRLQGVIAKSSNGSWMAQRDLFNVPGNPALVGYVSKGSGKHRVQGQHRASTALLELMRAAETKPEIAQEQIA